MATSSKEVLQIAVLRQVGESGEEGLRVCIASNPEATPREIMLAFGALGSSVSTIAEAKAAEWAVLLSFEEETCPDGRPLH